MVLEIEIKSCLTASAVTLQCMAPTFVSVCPHRLIYVRGRFGIRCDFGHVHHCSAYEII